MTSERRDAPQPFRIELEPHRVTIVLAVHGEIDLATSGTVTARVREVMEAGFHRVVLDLREVSFIDSSGLQAVLEANAAGRDAQVEFMLIPGPEAVQRMFDLTGIAGMLRFVAPDAIDRA